MRKKGAGRGSNRRPSKAAPASMPIRLHAQSSRRLERCGRLRARKDQKKDRQTDTQTDTRFGQKQPYKESSKSEGGGNGIPTNRNSTLIALRNANALKGQVYPEPWTQMRFFINNDRNLRCFYLRFSRVALPTYVALTRTSPSRLFQLHQ